MATLAINPAYRRMTVEEFLAADLGNAKAELVDGVPLMMVGSSIRHAAISANLLAALERRLRDSGYRAYGSELALRTSETTVRFPDVSVHRDQVLAENDAVALGDPKVVFEVLSISTTSNDLFNKLDEYRALLGVEQIVFVDPDNKRVRVVNSRSDAEPGWLPPGSPLALDSLGITIPADEIFLPG